MSQVNRVLADRKIVSKKTPDGLCELTFKARPLSAVPDPIRPGPSAREQISRSDELALLLTITNGFSSGASAHDVLESLYNELQQVLPFDRMEHAVLDETGHVLTTEWYRATYSSDLIPLGFAYRRPEPIARNERYRVTTLENNLPAYAVNRPDDHPVSLLVAEGIRSSLSCPLVVADEVVGYLFFNTQVFDGYTSHQANLIQLIAGQLASTLEQSRLNDRLREQNEQLRALEKSRLEFIASISHELRTPLTAVVGFASELQDRVDSFSDEEIAQFVGVIAAQSNEVSGIVEDLLVITRAEAGHLRVDPGPVNIAAEIREVAASLPNERLEQRIALNIHDDVVWADALRVRQIARNLLSNAVRYGGNCVEVTSSVEESQILMTVVDNGEGIPEKDQEMVFQAYGRSGMSDSKPGSIGLGLTVSRYLAEAMSGSLAYDRIQDKSHFSLRLPVYRPGRSRYDRA